MKTIIIILMLSVANIAYAAEEWSIESKTLASIFTVATVIDWGQTRDIVNNSMDQCIVRVNNGGYCDRAYHETNVFLGTDPTMNEVDTYMPAAIAIGLAVAHYLPEKYRVRFLYGMSFLELGTIYNNKKIGLKINF